MRKTLFTKLFACVLCAAMLASLMPVPTFAEEPAGTTINMTAGEVQAGFVEPGTVCSSTDESVAWVDEAGNLNAMKAGQTIITVPSQESGTSTDYTVTVLPYSDGSEIVGRLKILARYNDAMQFYDGHVYLLFTSYQDGVEITVNDLYGAYEISDQYYADIRDDISAGSNHTGSDTDKYFTFTNDLDTMTLDRGEIVTIGMYRGFDLSVPQAALGSVRNSTLWSALAAAGKTGAVEAIFQFLNTGAIDAGEALQQFRAVADEAGLDYMKLLDGQVEGGVCLNRELYNQKLEWDQFENVTYELDITRNQLDALVATLGGNLNHFSILKNSCATVAVRAWNAAVGTRNGEDTAYKLDPTGEGIFALMDAPKTVRDCMVARLPGCYLNNSENVAEPYAGYFEEKTGDWVYVSAPEPVAPLAVTYDPNVLRIDEGKTKLATLINAARGEADVPYAKDAQEVKVGVNVQARDGGDPKLTVNSIKFTVNESEFTLDQDSAPEGGIWFKTDVSANQNPEKLYVTDGDGKVIPSEYQDGWLSFYGETLPLTYQIRSGENGPVNILKTTVVNGDAVTENGGTITIYTKVGGNVTALDSTAEVAAGTVVYVKSQLGENDWADLLTGLTVNGVSILDQYDADEGAYYFEMPAKSAALRAVYEEAGVYQKGDDPIQIAAGEILNASDCAVILNEETFDSIDGKLCWEVLFDDEDNPTVQVLDGQSQLKGLRRGGIGLWLYAEGNYGLGVMVTVEVYENENVMGAVTFDDTEMTVLFLAPGEPNDWEIPYSGYRVEKSSILTIEPEPGAGQVVSSLTSNGKTVKPGQSVVVTGDTELKASFRDAEITGVPSTLTLAEQGDSYQLNAAVKYTGLYRLLPVYDESIRYESANPDLVSVDANGKITVVGEVPENGAAVIVTAYAGSSNDQVSAKCKVAVGDYDGARIVGRLTISSRRMAVGSLVPHSALTFEPYEDTELKVSYYTYYQPNEKYIDLLTGYDVLPEEERTTGDPALYNQNELGLTDRESYFNEYAGSSHADPQTVSVKPGECITFSNYGFDSENLTTLMLALKNGDLYTYSATVRNVVDQMEKYLAGEEIDGTETFDSLLSGLVEMYFLSIILGENPANGESAGGTVVNRELYNQFRRNDSQMPNNYYTVEITADELADLEAYLANPGSNYYSLFVKNCTTGVVDGWNAALADRPELQLKGNYTGLAAEAESLFFELALLRLKPGLDGESGTDFYPRPEYPLPLNGTVVDSRGNPVVNAAVTLKLGDETVAEAVTDSAGKFTVAALAGDYTLDVTSGKSNAAQDVTLPNGSDLRIALPASGGSGGGGGGGGGGGSALPACTVRFETNGGTPVQSVTVKKGQKLGAVETPSREGFLFDGWYTDAGCTAVFDLDGAVNASMTLYAAWKTDPALQFILTIGRKEALVWNTWKTNDVAPLIRNDRTMLPARFVAENLGAVVDWIGPERKVLITRDDTTIEIFINSDTAYVNGEAVRLDSPAFIENDRTYTPVRFVAERLGAAVDWNGETRQVIITRPAEQ